MEKKISNIVFTKNRPLQLHGYLESLRRFLPASAIQTYILYKPEMFDAVVSRNRLSVKTKVGLSCSSSPIRSGKIWQMIRWADNNERNCW